MFATSSVHFIVYIKGSVSSNVIYQIKPYIWKTLVQYNVHQLIVFNDSKAYYSTGETSLTYHAAGVVGRVFGANGNRVRVADER